MKAIKESRSRKDGRKAGAGEFIPLSVPMIKGNEWKYIKDCLDSGWVSYAGKYVTEFEVSIGKYTGARYAVACINGTSALQICLRIAGIAPADEVIVPTLTFIAPVNTVRYLNAEPVFMDCDEYYNLDSSKAIEFIKRETVFRKSYSYNKKTGRRISAIIPVHVFGNAAYLDDLVNVCGERNITIIEDATESLGTKYSEGKYQGKHAGTVGDFGCLSFNANKIITAGGGGMILTAQKKSAARARYLTTQAKDDEIRYIHNDVGYNFRLGNIQAALGVGQMENLGSYLKIKKDNYQTYKKGIDAIPGLHLASAPWYAENNHWMYALQIQRDKYGKSREELMAYLSRHNVQTRPVWYLNHRQKPYLRNQSYRIEKAPKMLDKTLNIPCSVGLSKDQINYLMDLLRYKRWGTR